MECSLVGRYPLYGFGCRRGANAPAASRPVPHHPPVHHRAHRRARDTQRRPARPGLQPGSVSSPVHSLHRPDQAHPPRRPASNGSSTGIPCRRDCLGPFPSPPPDGASRHIMPAMDQTSDILRFGPRTWLNLSRDAVKGSALRLIRYRSNQGYPSSNGARFGRRARDLPLKTNSYA